MMSPLRGMFMLGRPSYRPWHTGGCPQGPPLPPLDLTKCSAGERLNPLPPGSLPYNNITSANLTVLHIAGATHGADEPGDRGGGPDPPGEAGQHDDVRIFD